MVKFAVTLPENISGFLGRHTKRNHSAYTNVLLLEHGYLALKAEIETALKRHTEDAKYQAEIADWDSVVSDGFDI